MYPIFEFQKKKIAQEKISMITCYDFTCAKIIDKTNIDCVLVGDSVSMVVHGCRDTTGATMEMMALHTSAVAKGTNKFIIADLPFASYRKSSGLPFSSRNTKLSAAEKQCIEAFYKFFYMHRPHSLHEIKEKLTELKYNIIILKVMMIVYFSH